MAQPIEKSCSKNSLNIYEFILLLTNQQLKSENEISFLNVGHTPAPKRLKYKQLDGKIERLTYQYLNGIKTIIEFLDAVGYALKLGKKSNQQNSSTAQQ